MNKKFDHRRKGVMMADLALGTLCLGWEMIETVLKLKRVWRGYEYIGDCLPISYQGKKLRLALTYLMKQGKIERLGSRKEGWRYRLTEKGMETLVREWKCFSWDKKWDERWRLVSFDISETTRKDRDTLRRKLLEWGMGKFQQSLYISAMPVEKEIKEWLEDRGLLDRVVVLVVPAEQLGNPRLLATRIWDLEGAKKAYLKLHDRLRIVLMTGDEEKRRAGIGKLRMEFMKQLKNDPALPKELLGSDWPREIVKKKLMEF